GHTKLRAVLAWGNLRGPQIYIVDDSCAEQDDRDVGRRTPWRADCWDQLWLGDANIVLMRHKDDEPYRSEAACVG
ncbi:hypothetical protein BgiMline_032425, partial [Biomphalaria glabrata]